MLRIYLQRYKNITMKKLIFILFIAFITIVKAQEKVTFMSSDSLTITASLYEENEDYSYVLLFHQAGYSRGEYKESAKKIVKIGFNCLAVDLRSGSEVNYIKNETAALAKKLGYPDSYLDAEKDILAAINYAYDRNQKEVLLFGSSYSASLCLKVAKDNPKVKAVIAFSPGEFLKPLSVKDEISGLKKPVFIASSQREFHYIEELLINVSSSSKILFKPQNGQGKHGAKSLWDNCDTSKEYWLNLLLFLKRFKD